MTELSSNVDSKLSSSVIQQLQRKHICTVMQFIDEDSEKLVTCTGFPLKDILEIKRNILQKYGGTVKSAFDLFKIEQNNIISTNVSSLDNLLKGGLYPGQIYEICGISSSGKTQLCLTIASNIALEPNNIVRYIDTKRDFSGSRIEQILLKRNYNKQVRDEVMNRIKVCCIYKLSQLLKILRLLTIALKEEKAEYRTRIIIIDSLPGIIFKFSKSNETTIALNHVANMCHFIANEFHLSIITVNVITQWNYEVGSTSTDSGGNCNEVTPALGKYWSHVPNTRLLIEKIGFEGRKISVWKSFQLEPNLSCILTINDSGIL
ncbi:rad51 recombinase D [Osmia lignaria lignaria]|uniref:rad51 recombinase D n=1 Tax=Osmia lignaria lignaria TaxID=1437193 RepID=UPI0014784C8D|nr:DNA repair protein RAD51 homolog 4 [Osmia lignaria]